MRNYSYISKVTHPYLYIMLSINTFKKIHTLEFFKNAYFRISVRIKVYVLKKIFILIFFRSLVLNSNYSKIKSKIR
jgi:hypothetical protein